LEIRRVDNSFYFFRMYFFFLVRSELSIFIAFFKKYVEICAYKKKCIYYNILATSQKVCRKQKDTNKATEAKLHDKIFNLWGA